MAEAEVHCLVRVHHEDIDEERIPAEAPDGPGIGDRRIGFGLVRIENGQPLEPCVVAQRNERCSARILRAFRDQQYAALQG